jgi:uncharacterized membrane protein
MRATRVRHAGILLGLGLGAFFEGILMHPLGGMFYLFAWAVVLGGVVMLWAAVRGPGPLPADRVFVAHFVIGWGVFNMLEGLARHNLHDEWLVFATGMGFALLGAMLIWTRTEPIIERRSGYDRRSGSPVR